MITMFHIAETQEQARENVRHGLDAFRDYYNDVATFPIVPPDVTDPYTYLVESGAACVGTPDAAVAHINRLLEGTGGFGTILELAHNWADWGETKRHYELMARYVHPQVQASLGKRRDSYAFARDHHADFAGQSSSAAQAEIDRYARTP
jgi:limonene 1,2-monooxygenase